MAYTTIDDPSEYFHTQLYAGDASGNAQNITNDANAGDFKPDWLWIKERTSTSNHMVMDSSRAGDYNRIMPNKSDTEITSDPAVLPLTDGFSVADSDGGLNQASQTYVAWQWKVNGGTTETAVDESGNNPANVRQTNTDAGFSIITYTGTGSAGTIAHGLGVAPDWIIVKGRDIATDGMVYHGANTSAPETDALTQPETSATSDNAGWWNDTAPTSSSVYIGTHDRVNTDGKLFIAYCFAPIQGYSKFGGYVGTGNADGPFLYTGFKPAWVMIKETGATGSWHIFDNTRKVGNVSDSILYADLNNAEATSQTGNPIDILSNGFKCRGGGNDTNLDDGTYIYMAFAESPFVSSEGVPTTAR